MFQTLGGRVHIFTIFFARKFIIVYDLSAGMAGYVWLRSGTLLAWPLQWLDGSRQQETERQFALFVLEY